MSKRVAFFYHEALICVPTLGRVVYLIVTSKLADLPYEEVIYLIELNCKFPTTKAIIKLISK
jgi:hypothetical protein